MILPQTSPNEHFTYGLYRAWPEDERWELIDGQAHAMTPAPAPLHQEVVVGLLRVLDVFFRVQGCKVYVAPLDVRLPDYVEQSDDDTPTVVQPDLLVVCDPRKVDSLGVRGAPDLVVEVLSPSTAYRDETDKLLLYERHGVREYWIVNPRTGRVVVHALNKFCVYGKPIVYLNTETLRSMAFPDLRVDLSTVFGAIAYKEKP
jgi:Uma2 family endonuclease